jgi:succinyl-CoA synthetase beta subunit
MSIEETARNNPAKIQRTTIHPLMGLRDYQARDIASSIELPHKLWKPFIEILNHLWDAYKESDATLVEINPLVVTKEGELICLDAKMAIDDNALFLHPYLSEMRDHDSETPSESEARKYGLSYVKLEGDIGCLVNGAGLAMAVLDMIKYHGGNPANFLDIGGGASMEKVTAAMRIIHDDPDVKGIFINVFGGITRCDVVVQGVVSALRNREKLLPIIFRVIGTNAEEAIALLHSAGYEVESDLTAATKRIVSLIQDQP